MKSMSRILLAALSLLLVQFLPQTANAAFAPSGIGKTLDAATLNTEVVRGRGGRGGHGWARHGGGRHWGGGYRHRGYGWRGRGWGWAGPGYYGGAPAYYYNRSCIRRGWVFNGYNYVWRRYRVC